MIRCTFDAAAITAAAVGTVEGSRTVAGVAVPWNVPGVVSTGDTVVFHPGSLDASARPVLLRDHDRSRPIGTVADARDTGAALEATGRLTVGVQAADEALLLAADGALPMFSVGAEPTDYHYDDAGVLHVLAAVWRELSLLTIGAYDAARVATVTATNPEDPAMPPDTLPALVSPEDPDAPPVDPDAEPNPDIEPDERPVETYVQPELVPISAGRGVARVRQPHPYAGVGMRDLAGLICAAQASGDMGTARLINQIVTSPGARVAPSINAALTDVTLATGTTNVGAGYRPAYQKELVDIVSHGSPLVDAIRQGDLERGDYPIKYFNRWISTPQVALQAAEKVPINSTALEIGQTGVPVQTWATGNDLSQQLLDFGSPSFVEDYIRAAGVDYADTINTYAATALLAAATNVPTVVGDTFVGVVGKLVSALNPALVPAGGLFLAVSWDVWAGLIGVTQNNGPAFWSGSVSFGDMLPTAEMGGLSVFYSPGLPARTYLLGLRNAATWYDIPGTPFSLRAINVGQLGLDVAVYGYGALGVQYPGALVKTTQPAS